MVQFLSVFGACAFILLVGVILLLFKDLTKYKKENAQLHKDYETIIQFVPTISESDLEEAKNKILLEEDMSCQKS